MLINISRRTFILYSSENITNDGFELIINVNEMNDVDSLFYKIMDISKKTNRTLIWYFKNIGFFIKFIIKYFSILKINNPKILDTFIIHNKKFSNLSNKYTETDSVLCEKETITSMISNIDITGKINLNIGYIKLFPMEYFINMINSSNIAYNKYNMMRMEDILTRTVNLALYMFNSNIEYPEIFHKIFKNKNKEECFDFLINNKNSYLELKKIFEKYNMDTYLFGDDLEKYASIPTTFGYSSFNIFKFNRNLADFIKDIGYEIRIR